MPHAFTLPRHRCAVLSDPGLREEIRAIVETDAATDSILRCMERFGGESTIRYYEMTPHPSRRSSPVKETYSWTVSAVR